MSTSSHRLPTVSGLRRIVYLAAAAIFFGLAMLGVVLPGLPTTPFLLLTSYFLVRSWPALNERMLRSRFFGGILRDWQEHRGVRQHIKIKAIVLVVVAVSASAYFTALPPAMLAGLLLLAAIGVTVIVRLPNVE